MTAKEDPCRAICRERCANDSGDPPCYEIVTDWKPCDECLRDAGCEVNEERCALTGEMNFDDVMSQLQLGDGEVQQFIIDGDTGEIRRVENDI